MGDWTLFSNHGHVLVCLANNHQARLRDVAAEVGITERAVQNILRELQDSGLVQVSKHGRCNHYQINYRKSLRHPLESHCTVGKLLQLLKVADAEVSEPQAKAATGLATQKQTGKAEARPSKTVKPAPKQAVTHTATQPKAEDQAIEDPVMAARPTEARPVVAKSIETKPAESKPAVAKPVATKPVEARPAEAKPDQTQSVETEPTEAKPASGKKAKDKADKTPGTQQGSLF